MSITSLSFTFVNMYAPQSAKPAAPTERQPTPAAAELKSCEGHRPSGRQSRLVDAMMSALRELGFGNQGASAPAAQSPAGAQANAGSVGSADPGAAASAVAIVDAPGATPAAAAPDEAGAQPAATLESAVREFAHELFSALRQGGRGDASGQGSGRIESGEGRRQHHGHHGLGRQGYGDMSQRLDALSQTFAAPAVAATAAQDSAPVSASISITLTVQDGPADSPVQPLTSATPPAPSAAAAEPAAPKMAAPEIARNPLLQAFSRLFDALKPQAAGTPSMDMADKLRSFLQTLAQAMRPETMSSVQAPQVGGLVNVTA